MTLPTPEAFEALADLALISLHEKGFWQADLFVGAADIPADDFENMGMAPDAFKTFKRGGAREEAEAWVKSKWPKAKVEFALTDQPTEGGNAR